MGNLCSKLCTEHDNGQNEIVQEVQLVERDSKNMNEITKAFKKLHKRIKSLGVIVEDINGEYNDSNLLTSQIYSRQFSKQPSNLPSNFGSFKESRVEEIQIATVFSHSVHYDEEYLMNGDKIQLLNSNQKQKLHSHAIRHSKGFKLQEVVTCKAKDCLQDYWYLNKNHQEDGENYSPNIENGELIILQHVLTKKYLSIQETSKNNYQIFAANHIDDHCFWQIQMSPSNIKNITFDATVTLINFQTSDYLLAYGNKRGIKSEHKQVSCSKAGNENSNWIVQKAELQ